jgi:hypothetical protein
MIRNMNKMRSILFILRAENIGEVNLTSLFYMYKIIIKIHKYQFFNFFGYNNIVNNNR